MHQRRNKNRYFHSQLVQYKLTHPRCVVFLVSRSPVPGSTISQRMKRSLSTNLINVLVVTCVVEKLDMTSTYETVRLRRLNDASRRVAVETRLSFIRDLSLISLIPLCWRRTGTKYEGIDFSRAGSSHLATWVVWLISVVDPSSDGNSQNFDEEFITYETGKVKGDRWKFLNS